jgi:3-dehydroquinate dehydratase-2
MSLSFVAAPFAGRTNRIVGRVHLKACRSHSLGCQTNSETQLVDWIQEAIDKGDGIIINPAAYSFTSMAILDALKMFPGPIIELHITNIHRREALYHHSYVSKAATAVIAGLGPDGYRVALGALNDLLQRRSEN